MKIAYLINQYPKVSHSFIRREIAGVEACDLEVVRYAIRDCAAELVDQADKDELQKTKIVLALGLWGLIYQTLRTFLGQPLPLIKALRFALKMGTGSSRGLINHGAYLMEACVINQWCRQDRISHIHAHFGTNSATVALLTSILGGLPYSFTVHGPEEFDNVKGLALEAKILHATFVVGVSSFGKSQLYRWCPYEQWSKIHVVHCGVDDHFLSQPLTPIPQSPHLVAVGRLSEQKGFPLLLEAVAQLVFKGVFLKVTLVGDGPLRSQIEAYRQEKGLTQHIEITGWATSQQVQNHILAARALVLPSFAEGLPVVLMEALALGRPAISTYVAGIPELVEPGVSGWLVPPASLDALVRAMEEVLVSPVETLEQMGRNGAMRVHQHHNVHTEARKLVDLWRSPV